MLINAFNDALTLIVSADSDLMEILLLSMQVSFSALAIAGILAMPLGTILAISQFRPGSFELFPQRNDGPAAGRSWLVCIFDAL